MLPREASSVFFRRRSYRLPPSYSHKSRREQQTVGDISSRPRHEHDFSRDTQNGDPRYVPPGARLSPLAFALPAAGASEAMAPLDYGSNDVHPTLFNKHVGSGGRTPSVTLPVQVGSRKRRATVEQVLPPLLLSSLPPSSLEADPIARRQQALVPTGFSSPAPHASSTNRVSPEGTALILPPLRNASRGSGDQNLPLPRISPAGDLSSSPLGLFRASHLLPCGGPTDAVPAPSVRNHCPDPLPTRTARDQQDELCVVDKRQLAQPPNAASRHRRRHPV